MPIIFWRVLAGWLILAILTAFALMGIDKRRAKLDLWRIPERTLFLAVLLGGGLGGTLGMYLFHHNKNEATTL